MFTFRPEHGDRLSELPLTKYWCTLLECPESTCPGYIQVGDPQWVYPLLQLTTGVLPALKTASPQMLDEAFERIERIDYKTVSIVRFEQTILGCAPQRGD